MIQKIRRLKKSLPTTRQSRACSPRRDTNNRSEVNSLKTNNKSNHHQSALILAELSLIKRVLLTCSSPEIRTGKAHTEKCVAILAEILLDSHGIRLVNLTLLDTSSTGGADACTAGAGHCDSGIVGSGQDSLILPALKLMPLSIELKGDRINRRS